jgi:hypothetical protein
MVISTPEDFAQLVVHRTGLLDAQVVEQGLGIPRSVDLRRCRFGFWLCHHGDLGDLGGARLGVFARRVCRLRCEQAFVFDTQVALAQQLRDDVEFVRNPCAVNRAINARRSMPGFAAIVSNTTRVTLLVMAPCGRGSVCVIVVVSHALITLAISDLRSGIFF